VKTYKITPDLNQTQKKVLISFINNNLFDLSNIKFICEVGSTFINVVLPQKPTFHKEKSGFSISFVLMKNVKC
jgi:hypothetical protein